MNYSTFNDNVIIGRYLIGQEFSKKLYNYMTIKYTTNKYVGSVLDVLLDDTEHRHELKKLREDIIARDYEKNERVNNACLSIGNYDDLNNIYHIEKTDAEKIAYKKYVKQVRARNLSNNVHFKKVNRASGSAQAVENVHQFREDFKISARDSVLLEYMEKIEKWAINKARYIQDDRHDYSTIESFFIEKFYGYLLQFRDASKLMDESYINELNCKNAFYHVINYLNLIENTLNHKNATIEYNGGKKSTIVDSCNNELLEKTLQKTIFGRDGDAIKSCCKVVNLYDVIEREENKDVRNASLHGCYFNYLSPLYDNNGNELDYLSNIADVRNYDGLSANYTDLIRDIVNKWRKSASYERIIEILRNNLKDGASRKCLSQWRKYYDIPDDVTREDILFLCSNY